MKNVAGAIGPWPLRPHRRHVFRRRKSIKQKIEESEKQTIAIAQAGKTRGETEQQLLEARVQSVFMRKGVMHCARHKEPLDYLGASEIPGDTEFVFYCVPGLHSVFLPLSCLERVPMG